MFFVTLQRQLGAKLGNGLPLCASDSADVEVGVGVQRSANFVEQHP